MSTLLKQVAEPQDQSNKPKLRDTRPSQVRQCSCGELMERNSKQCMACWKNAKKSPIDSVTHYIDTEPCRFAALTQGQYAIVLEEDYDKVMNLGFYAHWHPEDQCFRAYRMCSKKDGKRHYIQMSNVILDLPPNVIVDHKNGVTLDYRRSNLRPATPKQNAANRKVPRNSRSGYLGVYYRRGLWIARMYINEKLVSLGAFPTAELAARRRDIAAIKKYGEFARLNFPNLIDEYHRELSL